MLQVLELVRPEEKEVGGWQVRRNPFKERAERGHASVSLDELISKHADASAAVQGVGEDIDTPGTSAALVVHVLRTLESAGRLPARFVPLLDKLRLTDWVVRPPDLSRHVRSVAALLWGFVPGEHDASAGTELVTAYVRVVLEAFQTQDNAAVGSRVLADMVFDIIKKELAKKAPLVQNAALVQVMQERVAQPPHIAADARAWLGGGTLPATSGSWVDRTGSKSPSAEVGEKLSEPGWLERAWSGAKRGAAFVRGEALAWAVDHPVEALQAARAVGGALGAATGGALGGLSPVPGGAAMGGVIGERAGEALGERALGAATGVPAQPQLPGTASGSPLPANPR